MRQPSAPHPDRHARRVTPVAFLTLILLNTLVVLTASAPSAGAAVEVAAAPCGAGYVYSETADACLPCDDGYYQDQTDATTTDTRNPNKVGCKPARTGHFADGLAQAADTVCPKGTYQDETGRRSCKEAPAGSFVADTGQAAATPCAPGTYQPATGQTSCRVAEKGYYVPTAGATTQILCATATTTGSRTCPAAAPTPTPTPAPDDTEPEPELATGDRPDGEPCPAGSWSADGLIPTASSCTPASPGTYAAGPGATEETECAPGTYSGVFGATECTPASVGFYVPTAGASVQLPCPTATEPGASTCGEALAAELPADSGGRGRLLPILVAFVAVLIAAGAFVLLRQRGLVGASRPLPSANDSWARFDDPAPPVTREPRSPYADERPAPYADEPPAPPERPTRRFDDDLFSDDFDDL